MSYPYIVIQFYFRLWWNHYREKRKAEQSKFPEKIPIRQDVYLEVRGTCRPLYTNEIYPL